MTDSQSVLLIIMKYFSIEKLDDIHRFNDWIINIQWLEPLNDPTLTILFAHNNVCNYDFHKKQYTNTSCKETCLLYPFNIHRIKPQ